MRAINLLIVDDDDVDRERLRRLLQRLEINVSITEAGSIAEARAHLQRSEFDCALVDYRLGDATGTDLVRLIKSELGRPFPVIMVTGIGDERVAVEAMREGVYDYLSKAQLRPQQIKNAIEGSLRWVQLETELAETQERLMRLSMFDSLTGLPNRNLFFDRLEQALRASGRGGATFALLMMDLNLFKEVNDTLGHEAGDKVLAEFGHRLQQLSRKSDTYARLGGDEFAGLLMGTDSVAGAVAVAEKVGRALRAPVAIEGDLVAVGVSIGIALFPAHGADARTLLANADQSMYEAKRSSKDYKVFTSRTSPGETNPFLVSSHLGEALDRKELFLHYQPKVSLQTGELVGVEALVRWQSHRFGLLAPSDFIPAAERSSLINPMTYAILDMALEQSRLWRDDGVELSMAVNLSARVLDDERLAERVVDALSSRGLKPETLMLEITETALMTSPTHARDALHALREAGVGISIDDFGTGYTSLKYLRDFPISEIKIDRLFISSLKCESRDASIVRSISALSDGFDVDLVAEGIESLECCPLLYELGCDFGQGFSIAYPMPADDLIAWRSGRASLMPSSGAKLRSAARLALQTSKG